MESTHGKSIVLQSASRDLDLVVAGQLQCLKQILFLEPSSESDDPQCLEVQRLNFKNSEVRAFAASNWCWPCLGESGCKSNLNIPGGDALSRKERVKSRRVKGMILAAQSEVFKQENVLAERLHGLDQQMERKRDESWYSMDRIWILLVGSVMDEAHASRYLEWNSGDDQPRIRWMIYLMVLADAAESVRDAIGFEYCLASSSGWTKSLVLRAEIRESSLTGLELVQETTDKVVLVNEKPKAVKDR
ncbi:hypothetical protein Tco_0453766 [Tanacetum coccineum]